LLTGLLNYRGFHERLADELARCRRAGLPLSVVAIDFDKLKQGNDSLGHRVGDEALKILAREISYGSAPATVALRHSSEQAIVDSQRLVNSAIELQQQTRSGRTRRERTLRERTVSKRHRP
jgi:diguanylate cyclase (GGDEF)-like protein